MNWFAFHMASGASLFSGAALLVAGILLLSKVKGRFSFLGRLSALLGLVLILLSSTPFPLWCYLGFIALAAAWMVVESAKCLKERPFVRVVRILLTACVLCLVAIEIPHRVRCHLPARGYAQLCVVGDSISAGIDEKPNWVEIFKKSFGAKALNLAKPAATLQSSLKQAESIPSTDCLVLLEIGGNDLFGKISEADFEQDLRRLLKSASSYGRTVIMIELPLLPGQAGLGRVQRRLAKEYGIPLIPKSQFCRVLAAPNATTDGLHLSASGTSLMAQMVHESIGSLLAH